MHKLIEASVFAAIGVLVFAALLIPVVDDATATTEKLTNTGYYTMDKVDENAEFTLTWEQTNPKILDIDGETINLDNRGLTPGKAYTVFGADNFVLRLYWANSPFLQYFGDKDIIPAFISATSAGSVFTVSVAGGEVTFTSTDPTYPDSATIPLNDTAYCVNVKDKGAYVMKNMDAPAFIETTTDIIVLDGITTLTANDVGIYADGTINGDLNAVVFRGNATYDVTFSDWTYDTSDVNGYINLVNLEKVVFTATQNNQDYTVTYSYFIVPATVTAEKAIHADEPTREVLEIMPLILIAGLIIGVLGYVVYSRIE